jgi:hypothetical protein
VITYSTVEIGGSVVGDQIERQLGELVDCGSYVSD